MDFYTIVTDEKKSLARPVFVTKAKYDDVVFINPQQNELRFWDEQKGIWVSGHPALLEKIYEDTKKYANEHGLEAYNILSNTNPQMLLQYIRQQVPNPLVRFDSKVRFASDELVREDMATFKLNYDLSAQDPSAYLELMSTLYSPVELEKLEWFLGCTLRNELSKAQKFLCLYGEPGSGKSTVIKIIKMVFGNYCGTFSTKRLCDTSNDFKLEELSKNFVLAVDDDANLKNLSDPTQLNQVVSQESVTVNKKYTKTYTDLITSGLLCCSNTLMPIYDAYSGLVRRLMYVEPTGEKIASKKFEKLMAKIANEKGAIALRWMGVYDTLGPMYYKSYTPLQSMRAYDITYQFVRDHEDIYFSDQKIFAGKEYDRYKAWCEKTLNTPLRSGLFNLEFGKYFRGTKQEGTRTLYVGFLGLEKNIIPDDEAENEFFPDDRSLFDELACDYVAQYSTAHGTPKKSWDDVDTVLKELDTSLEHFVRVPLNHIVIDFDIKVNGMKSLQANIDAAKKWPDTYAEISKGGNGVHLHYIYNGDPETLKSIYDKDIEVKVYIGKSSLRRRLSKCRNIEISTLEPGFLPIKEKKVISQDIVITERGIIKNINAALRKEHHGHTKPEMDFIKMVLDEAYESGVVYSVRNKYLEIMQFAMSSSNQRDECMKVFWSLKWQSEFIDDTEAYEGEVPDEKITFFDIEVFPNVNMIVIKRFGKDARLTFINPTPDEMDTILKLALAGYNCRGYDNHIAYNMYMGASTMEIFKQSKQIIDGSGGTMPQAWNLSYVDVYDMLSKKQSLKKWEVELDLPYDELDVDWNAALPEEQWERCALYCGNDVVATEEVFVKNYSDYIARKILAKLTGQPVNSSTHKLTQMLIFGDTKDHTSEFKYTDLSEMFPGYTFDKYRKDKSMYKGYVVGEGGFVWSKPGVYRNAGLLDVESMHPTSLELLNHFGIYTQSYADLKEARLAIKHKDLDKARTLMNGELAPFLDDPNVDLKALSYALKIVINIVYGLTSKKDGPFRMPENDDNIVAKRGALFMIDLMEACIERGYEVIHIKTDSIKIANITPEIVEFVEQFGFNYGYRFEHEATYAKIALVNDAVYVAQDLEDGHWTSTGKEFAVPFVFKSLFSKEPLELSDFHEIKQVQTALYFEDENEKREFIGRAAKFIVTTNGRELKRRSGDKFAYPAGAKGWKFSRYDDPSAEDNIDYSYYEGLAADALAHIVKVSSPKHLDWLLNAEEQFDDEEVLFL